MMRKERPIPVYLSMVTLPVLLLALGGLGYLAFLAFVKGILVPGEFATYGLLFTTVAAATAGFFSPCSFTVLPGYIAFASSGNDLTSERRLPNALKNGLVAALGVVTAVAALGVLLGALGTGIGPELGIVGPNPNVGSRVLRITIGAFVLSMGLLHIMDLSHRIPLLGRISALAIRAQGEGGPSLRSVYAYGAGYVLVGLG